MSSNPTQRPRWQRWIIRHLYLYLAIVAGISVAVSILLARGELARAIEGFPLLTAAAVLSLSTLNYAIRFAKWDRLLADSSIRIPRGSSALIYFACLSMVVTPARLGELYKLVFLRRLHGVSPSRSLPPLILERATDVLALVALCAAQPFAGSTRIAAVAGTALLLIGLGALLAAPVTRRPFIGMAARLPLLRSRAARVEQLIDGHTKLLVPRSLAPNLALSILAWWAECIGLWLICRGLGASLSLGDATWIYATATLLGNLTFLPGGLGGTEVALKTLLQRVGVGGSTALGATLLVRGATLWFAVFLGLAVTLTGRKHLHWREVQADAAAES
jgi:uncharacterized protein (TIRG00374 family)